VRFGYKFNKRRHLLFSITPQFKLRAGLQSIQEPDVSLLIVYHTASSIPVPYGILDGLWPASSPSAIVQNS
jgi:hypothetical protein